MPVQCLAQVPSRAAANMKKAGRNRNDCDFRPAPACLRLPELPAPDLP
jgi:hypothetical protein